MSRKRKIQHFSLSITKEIKRIDKNRQKPAKQTSYRLQFIDSARFMASSLSNLVDNLIQRIHKIKYKHGHDNKKM